MCSIFGVIGEYNYQKTKRAFNSLAHRGEDSSKIAYSKEFFFGSHRLTIESINQLQNQPIIKKDFIAIFNGEIYNYKELIDNFNLNAKDEIETILELFLIKRERIFKYLRGMYAISIFNIKSKELWLFRDLAGKKPLYFTYQNGIFSFASEMKALTNLNGFKLDRRAIHHYLGYGATVSPETLDRYIKKLPPSSYLYFNGKGNIKIEEFEPILREKIEFYNLKDSAKELEKRLLEAVKIRIPSVKYGVLVSGGLDSSLIASMVSKVSKEKIDIFSIGYDGYEKYDERKYAEEVANHIGANFNQFNFTKRDFFQTLKELMGFIDDPIGDPAQIPLFFLIKKAKERGVKVLLSGDGSDELFLGYRQYKEYYSMESVKNLPYSNWLKNHLRRNFSMNKEWEWYKRALNGEVIFRTLAEIYTDRQLNLLLRLQERDNKNFEYIGRYWDYFKKYNRDIIDWYSYIDLKVQLGEFFLVKVDRVSMANGVEVRSPFLDNEVIKLAFKISPKVRFNSSNVKEVLKEVANGYIPKSIVERKKKGLSYPFIEWILEENGLDVIFEANRKFNIFNNEHLDFLSSKASRGKFKQHLFPLYILSYWLLENSKYS